MKRERSQCTQGKQLLNRCSIVIAIRIAITVILLIGFAIALSAAVLALTRSQYVANEEQRLEEMSEHMAEQVSDLQTVFNSSMANLEATLNILSVNFQRQISGSASILQQVTQAINETRQLISDQTSDINALRMDLSSKYNELSVNKASSNDLNQLRTDLASTNTSLTATKVRVRDLEMENSRLNLEIWNLEIEANALRTDVNIINRNTINNVKRQINALESTVNSLNTEVDALETRVNNSHPG